MTIAKDRHAYFFSFDATFSFKGSYKIEFNNAPPYIGAQIMTTCLKKFGTDYCSAGIALRYNDFFYMAIMNPVDCSVTYTSEHTPTNAPGWCLSCSIGGGRMSEYEMVVGGYDAVLQMPALWIY